MRRIKIKLPFTNESILKRRIKLIETVKVLSNNQNFTIVEEEHYAKLSYIVVLVTPQNDNTHKTKTSLS